MKQIEQIIKTIDKELIEKNKKFISLGQANKILLENRVISKTDKLNQLLKKWLEDGKISNSSQTKEKPRQWRIFLSEEGHLNKTIYDKKKKKELLEKEKHSITCPYCQSKLTINKSDTNSLFLVCSICNNQFENYKIKRPRHKKEIRQRSVRSTDEFKISKNLKNWIFGALGLLVIYFIATDNSFGLKVKNSPWDNSVHQVESYLKRNLKDPNSFEALSWSKVKDKNNNNNGYRYKVFVKYRAKNSFGGYVVKTDLFYLDEKGNVVRVE